MNHASYTETGGLRWGRTFWLGANATWPFAVITANTRAIAIAVSVLGIPVRRFELARDEVLAIRRRRGLFSVGASVEHRTPGVPACVVFWTWNYERLAAELGALDYPVESENT